MKFRHYEDFLSRNKTTFSKPKVALEQYATDPHLASRLGWTAYESGDLEGKIVLDLGCGSGMLSLAASVFADAVIAVDIDREVFDDFDHENIECILADVEKGLGFVRKGCIDTVFTNPPFGTKNNAGIDTAFVHSALAVAPVCYSMHKSSCRQVIQKKFQKQNITCNVIAEMSFELPRQFRFHKENCLSIPVDLMRNNR
jgi:rRNA N6-adenosine-methyltransferase METTL5